MILIHIDSIKNIPMAEWRNTGGDPETPITREEYESYKPE